MRGATAPGKMAGGAIARVVALGVSNLTRGFQTVVSTARSAWGPHVEVLGAHGHGRRPQPPLAGMTPLSRPKFLAVRSIIVPGCRISLAQMLRTAERVQAGLATIALSRRLTFFRLNPLWYGFDPIHIRPSLWRTAWQEILAGGRPDGHRPRSTPAEGLRLDLMPPERQWLLGREQVTPQPGVALRAGGRVWLF